MLAPALEKVPFICCDKNIQFRLILQQLFQTEVAPLQPLKPRLRL